MADNVVSFSAMTSDELKQTVASLRSFLSLAKTVTKFTPTKVDDNAVETLSKILDVVEPFLNEPAAADLLNFIMGLLSKGGASGALDKLKNAF